MGPASKRQFLKTLAITLPLLLGTPVAAAQDSGTENGGKPSFWDKMMIDIKQAYHDAKQAWDWPDEDKSEP